MEKLLLAICLLATLAGALDRIGAIRRRCEIEIRASDRLRIDLRVDSGGPVECELLLRGQIVNLNFTSRGCLWRPCHA